MSFSSLHRVLAGLMATVLCHSALAVDVRDVRLWAGPDNTRVVVDLSASPKHSLVVLHHPERVVLDVPRARLGKRAQIPPRALGTIKRVRVSRSPSGNFRLVLELARPTQAKSFLTTPNAHYGYRLGIDLGGVAGVRARVPVPDKAIMAKHAPADARDLIIAIDA